MSDNSYDFGDILEEAQKGRTPGDGGDKTRLNGTFKLVAKYAAGDRKTAKGFPQIGIVWQVVGGPHADEEVWQNVVFSPKSKGVAGRALLSLGVSAEYLKSISGPGNFTQGLLDIADALVGAEVEMKISPQASNKDFDNFEVLEIVSGPVLEVAPLNTVPSFDNGPVTQVSYSSPHVNPAAQNGQVGVPTGVVPQPVTAGGFIPQV